MLLHSIVSGSRAAAFPHAIPVQTGHYDPLSQPLALLGLPGRALNALHAAGLSTLRDAADWSLRDLKTLPQVGPAALTALQDALHDARLDLQPSARRKRL
jgi:DNA-directed RNA polymerase alpha subunit